jgi:hypothetical protein
MLKARVNPRGLDAPNAERKKTAHPAKGAPFFYTAAGQSVLPSRSNEPFAGRIRLREKNPGLSPGKRYVIQRIGAFGQLKPCERQRHDAVACDNAGPVCETGRRDARLET